MLQQFKRSFRRWADDLAVARVPAGSSRACLRVLERNGFSPKFAIDVGAHDGGWSADLKRVFPDCAVALVEPLAEMQPMLAAFCRRHPDARVYPMGLSDQIEERIFTVRRDLLPASSFHIPAEEATRNGWERRKIPVSTLDALLEREGRVPDIIKIDAEGCDLAVLKGGSSIWNRTQVIFVEASLLDAEPGRNGFGELIRFMENFSYVPFDFTWFMRREGHGALFLCEVVFVPRGVKFRQW